MPIVPKYIVTLQSCPRRPDPKIGRERNIFFMASWMEHQPVRQRIGRPWPRTRLGIFMGKDACPSWLAAPAYICARFSRALLQFRRSIRKYAQVSGGLALRRILPL